MDPNVSRKRRLLADQGRPSTMKRDYRGGSRPSASNVIDLCDEDDESSVLLRKDDGLSRIVVLDEAVDDDDVEVVYPAANYPDAGSGGNNAALLRSGDERLAFRLQQQDDRRNNNKTYLQSDLRYARRLQREENSAAAAARAPSDFDERLARRLQSEENSKKTEIEPTYDVLEQHRNFVRAQVAPHVSNIVDNIHAKVGSDLYNRFIEAWQRVENQSIILAFHGTATKNVASICKNGFNPKFRFGQALGKGEYFAFDMNVAIPYCKGGTQMLVVALIVDQSGLTTIQNNVIVVHKTDHQLPLFVIHTKAFPYLYHTGISLAGSSTLKTSLG